MRMKEIYRDPPIGFGVRKILDAIQIIDPSAIVAGGFLRDRMLNGHAKDIDIFVGPEFKVKDFEADNNLILNEMTPQNPDSAAYATGTLGGILEAVYELGSSKTDLSWNVQIIKTREELAPKDHMDRFDWDICCWWTDGFTFYGPAHYQEWSVFNPKDNVARLRSGLTNSQIASSIQRAKRWQRDNGYPPVAL